MLCFSLIMLRLLGLAGKCDRQAQAEPEQAHQVLHAQQRGVDGRVVVALVGELARQLSAAVRPEGQQARCGAPARLQLLLQGAPACSKVGS